MKEADFQKWVTDTAESFGWKWWHVPAPMRWSTNAREAAGLPDLVLLHDDPPRMILAEVKGDGGKLSEQQAEFLRMARDVADHVAELCGPAGYPPQTKAINPLGVYLFEPSMEDAIEQMLRSKVLT